MVFVAIGFALLAVAATVVSVTLWLRNRELAQNLRRTAPYLIAGGSPAPLVGILTGLLDWEVIDRGGDEDRGHEPHDPEGPLRDDQEPE